MKDLLAEITASERGPRYLACTDSTNRLVEFTDGYLEVLPMPTDRHQSILQFSSWPCSASLTPRGGSRRRCACKSVPVSSASRICWCCFARMIRAGQSRFRTGADLGPSRWSARQTRTRSHRQLRDYAEGRVREYWIVNPMAETITILRLAMLRRAGQWQRGGRRFPSCWLDFRSMFRRCSARIDSRFPNYFTLLCSPPLDFVGLTYDESV